jgi:DNA-binding NtrC family response regulator
MRSAGAFERAHGGTLLLDEISEMRLDLQSKLLRVLQEHEFERVGGHQAIRVDVRLIATTNRDLKHEAEAGRFRSDLYYRLNVMPIRTPPLRERKEDIPLLVAAFLKEFSQENGKPIEGIDPKARQALYNYSWPGNVRQLRNSVESAVVLSKGTTITLEDFPPNLRGESGNDTLRLPLGASLAEMEKEVIRSTLAREGGNKSRTAEVLGIGRKTLHRKIEEYGL